jgi:tRNA pseudouridine13 synthase
VESGQGEQGRRHALDGARGKKKEALGAVFTSMELDRPAGVEEDPEEAAVGIACYANSAGGFRAILKERYTDFVVNEIDLAGEVVHLTTLVPVVDNEINDKERQRRQKLAPTAEPAAAAAVAQEKEEAEPIKPEEIKSAAAAARGDEVKELDAATAAAEAAAAAAAAKAAAAQEAAQRESALAAFTKLAGAVESERLRAFLATPGVLARAPEGCEPAQPLFLGASNDKGYRTSLHQFFSIHFQLLTDTVSPPGGDEGSGPTKTDSKRPHLCIRVHPKKHPRGGNGGGGGGQKRSREENGEPTDTGWGGHQRWPSGVPNHLEFTLCKENKDTGDAIGILSRILHLKPKAFGFAGTKDKRGVTSQRVTLYKVRAARLAKLTLHGMKVGDFRYVDRHLGLGDLKGNLFTLTLRGVEGGVEETVGQAVKALTASGFINYFGLQRFGTHAIATHVVGAALLRGDWSEAIDLILRPRDADKPDAAAARAVYKETGDAAAALKLMPHWCVAERGLLEGLVRVKGKDLVGALSGVPRPTRKMYVHAYQVGALRNAFEHVSSFLSPQNNYEHAQCTDWITSMQLVTDPIDGAICGTERRASASGCMELNVLWRGI